MLDLDLSSSRDCSSNAGSTNTQFAIISLNSIRSYISSPEPRGEKDWRIWGRGGRAPDLKATATSGEDTTQICGLSDTGSVGGISGSAGDETRQSRRRSTRHGKSKRAYITAWKYRSRKRYDECICYSHSKRQESRCKENMCERKSGEDRSRKGLEHLKATTKVTKTATTESVIE